MSGIAQWSRSPHLGGQASRGMGLADLRYALVDLDTGERVEVAVEVRDGTCLLAPPAEAARQRYDAYLRAQYDAMLAARSGEIAGLLGVGQ